MDEQNAESVTESISLKVADNAMPVCPNCLSECDPRLNYCPFCDSNEVINPLVPYLPFEGIRFGAGVFGKLWRKTGSSKTPIGHRILYNCLLLFFIPAFFFIMFPASIAYKHLNRKNRL